MKSLLRGLCLGLWTTLLVSLTACGGGSGGIGGTGTQPEGTLRLAIADAPACGYDAVNISVQKVRVHQDANAGDDDAGWSEIVLAPPKRVDLLSLTNGVLAELGQVPLPAGKYTQMRLVLASNDSSNPLANSVVPTGGSETPLTTPSAQQSGLKLNVDIDVAPNQLADFVIDFDACKSVVKAGNSGKYLLKPVVRVIPRLVSAVQGDVDASLANGQTSVTLQSAGVVARATVPDANGHFLLQPVQPGTYDLVVTAPGRATAVITDVVVASGAVTSVNTAGTALNPPASGSGTLLGVVSTGATPIDASISVSQALSIGRSIAIATAPVDADTGAYSFLVPVAAPLVAPFVSGPGPLVFAADNTAAGQYGLTAQAGAATKTTPNPVTVTAGGSVTTNFSFP